MAFIEVEDVSFSYPNGFQAVNGVNLSIDTGESVAIIGQNGAGKTTFVKMLNGLLKPSHGEVRIGSVATTERTAAQTARHVGYVFQNPDDQIFNSTVYKEVGYALHRLSDTPDTIDQTIKEACELCGLGDELETNPYDLPLSIRKFITIASVIAVDPEVFILDEPTAGQDLAGLNRIATIINHLQDQGKIVITITHDMEFVANHFNRVIAMANKQVISDGGSNDVFFDTAIMHQARLNPPVVAELASILNAQHVGLNMQELAAFIKAAN